MNDRDAEAEFGLGSKNQIMESRLDFVFKAVESLKHFKKDNV